MVTTRFFRTYQWIIVQVDNLLLVKYHPDFIRLTAMVLTPNLDTVNNI